jgi:hypothetical protein
MRPRRPLRTSTACSRRAMTSCPIATWTTPPVPLAARVNIDVLDWMVEGLGRLDCGRTEPKHLVHGLAK